MSPFELALVGVSLTVLLVNVLFLLWLIKYLDGIQKQMQSIVDEYQNKIKQIGAILS